MMSFLKYLISNFSTALSLSILRTNGDHDCTQNVSRRCYDDNFSCKFSRNVAATQVAKTLPSVTPLEMNLSCNVFDVASVTQSRIPQQLNKICEAGCKKSCLFA